jgi:hypothetical protein
MTLAFRGIEISGIRDSALRTRVSIRIGAALGPLRGKPLAARVTFFDDNGPKGGRAMRCALTVRLPYRPSLRVEHTAVTARLAFDASLKSLERLLERYRELDRERRRHPKKYYAAKRVLEGETTSTTRRRSSGSRAALQ